LVLSPTTEAYDRGEKLEHYKTIPSLREVVLVAHDQPRIEVWPRLRSAHAVQAEAAQRGDSSEVVVEREQGPVGEDRVRCDQAIVARRDDSSGSAGVPDLRGADVRLPRGEQQRECAESGVEPSELAPRSDPRQDLLKHDPGDPERRVVED
jgi:hypothetical protein